MGRIWNLDKMIEGYLSSGWLYCPLGPKTYTGFAITYIVASMPFLGMYLNEDTENKKSQRNNNFP